MAAAKQDASLSLVFDRAKETKGTWMYEERQAEGDSRPAVGRIYITKSKLGMFGSTPSVLRMTIEAGE